MRTALLLALCACSPEEDTTNARPPTDCDAALALTPCGTDGLCIAGACITPTECPGGGCADHGQTSPVTDTNLRICAGRSPDSQDGEIPCPGTPGAPDCADTEFCGQDAQYGWDAEMPPEARLRATPENGERVVTDTVTGLVWQGCAAGQAGAGCTGDAVRTSWHDAAAACESSTWGGHDDWVLPTAGQLHSITDFGTTSPAMDRSVFANAPSTFADDYEQWWIECIWSSTDYAGDPDVAWAMMANNGDISQGSGIDYHLHDKPAAGWEGCHSYCVRERPRPGTSLHERFVVLGDEPIVADFVGERMWQGCSIGQFGPDCDGDAEMLDWSTALSTCERLAWGGYDDWRLPDVKELRSIVDLTRSSPAIDDDVFPGTPYYGPDTTQNIGHYWSSTVRTYNDFALYVDFGSGFSHFYVQSELRHVRCVRG